MDLKDCMNEIYYKLSVYELQMMHDDRIGNSISYNTVLYLNIISFTKKCTASHIADMLHIARSSATIKINQLVEQGYVVRTQSEEDKRIFYLTLSPEVEKVFSEEDLALEKTIDDVEHEFSEEEVDLLCRMLKRLSKGLDMIPIPDNIRIGRQT